MAFTAVAAEASGDDPAASQAQGPWDGTTLTGNWGGARTWLEDAGIKIAVQEQSEVWANPRGGIRTGVLYNGLTTASVTFDLQQLAGWSGATLFASAYQIHGRGPSTRLVGNQQLLSNIEATPASKLYNLWIEQ